MTKMAFIWIFRQRSFIVVCDTDQFLGKNMSDIMPPKNRGIFALFQEALI